MIRHKATTARRSKLFGYAALLLLLHLGNASLLHAQSDYVTCSAECKNGLHTPYYECWGNCSASVNWHNDGASVLCEDGDCSWGLLGYCSYSLRTNGNLTYHTVAMSCGTHGYESGNFTAERDLDLAAGCQNDASLASGTGGKDILWSIVTVAGPEDRPSVTVYSDPKHQLQSSRAESGGPLKQTITGSDALAIAKSAAKVDRLPVPKNRKIIRSFLRVGIPGGKVGIQVNLQTLLRQVVARRGEGEVLIEVASTPGSSRQAALLWSSRPEVGEGVRRLIETADFGPAAETVPYRGVLHVRVAGGAIAGVLQKLQRLTDTSELSIPEKPQAPAF